MNTLNIVSAIILGILIFFAVYFIKNNAEKKQDISYPFFVSTRDSTTNIRSGPSRDYPVIWVYNRKMIPIKVIDSNKEWYKIEDITGQTGWIYKNIVNNTKSAFVLEESSIYISSQINSKVVAIIKKNNILKIIKCQQGLGAFCKVEVNALEKTLKGWIHKNRLWGAVE